MAGTGKKSDTNKPSINPKTYFGQKGFVSKMRKKEKAVNVDDLASFDKKGDGVLDLGAQGVTKLLGSGTAEKKFTITVKNASKIAMKKITAAGGSITTNAEKGETAKK